MIAQFDLCYDLAITTCPHLQTFFGNRLLLQLRPAMDGGFGRSLRGMEEEQSCAKLLCTMRKNNVRDVPAGDFRGEDTQRGHSDGETLR